MSSEDVNSGKDNIPKRGDDTEDQRLIEKVKYPRAIPFIISNEFCERFNYYGIRTILVLYMVQKLDMSQDNATIVYHGFTTLVYFMCIVGAVVADSWWGKFNTILWLSMVYVAGTAVLAVSAIETWGLPMMALTFVGLGLIAVGSGGIKPCVAAFGGEQFKLPQQAKQVAVFFSIFYFSINLGSFISTSVTPLLRNNVKCFGNDNCYPLGFGVPSALMVVSILVFLSGKFLYKINPPSGNMLMKVCKCVATAIKTKSKQKATNPKEHWLEYAEDKFGKKLVTETKILLNVLVLYLPLPFFWTLFDQQGSRWTFQATRMNGDLGFYTILPDQMQVVNPFLILAFIPLYEVIFYPLLNLIGIRRPLQKITLGGILAGVAFLCSMFVEIAVEPTYAKLPKVGEAQIRLFNGVDCTYLVSSPAFSSSFDLPPRSLAENLEKEIKGTSESFKFTFTSKEAGCEGFDKTFTISENKASSFFIKGTQSSPVMDMFEDNPDKTENGEAAVRILINSATAKTVELFSEKGVDLYNTTNFNGSRFEVPRGKYELKVDYTLIKKDIDLKVGGVYAIVTNGRETEVITVTTENSVSMLWLIPQYVIMTLGEVMYSVTGLQFSYNEAPESMRSVLQGCWQLTVAVGNLIVTIIVGAKFFDSQIYEFALFAGLMFVDMAVFMWLAIRYKSLKSEEITEADEKAIEEKKKTETEDSDEN